MREQRSRIYMDIPDGTPFVIYSYGTKFKDNGDIGYHTSRGTKTVPLTSALNAKIELDMSKVETKEFRVDVNLLSTFNKIYNIIIYLFYLSIL